MYSKPVRPRALTVSADPFAYRSPIRVDGKSLRQPPSPYDRSLDKSAANWLRELPLPVRPRATVIRFPRIVNRLARYWDTPAVIEATFDDLLVDKRGGRKGFPPEIQTEIRALFTHYRKLHPANPESTVEASDLWTFIPERPHRITPRWPRS